MAKRKKSSDISSITENSKKLKKDDQSGVKEEETFEDLPDANLLEELELNLIAPEDNSEDFVWSKDELKTLLTRVEEATPQNSTAKFSTALEKIDWENIKFGNFTADECKASLNSILNKIRKFRTLDEVLADANHFLDNPQPIKASRIVHPDMPKKPISPFFKYYQRNLKEYQERYGKIPLSQLSKLAAEDYAKLSAKKKAKQRETYLQEFEEYREKLKAFKEEHPTLFPEKSKVSKSKEPIQKPQTPFQLFFQAKSNNYESENKKELVDALRTKWNNLKEKKKIKWIKKSDQDYERYKQESKEYMKTHPDYEPKLSKSCLSKNELALKYKFEGRPVKPPSNGYALYSKIMLSEIKDVPAHEKMVIIGKKWNQMTSQEKKHYNKVAEKETSQYFEKFDAYIQQLPEEEREEALKGIKLPSEKKLKVSVKNSKTNNKNRESLKYSAMMAFQFQELPKLESKYPDKSKTEIMKMVNDNWEKLDETENQKYFDMVQSFQDFMPGPSIRNKPKKKGSKDSQEIEFESLTGLKRPKANGFSVFTKDYFSKYANSTDSTPKEKMVLAGEAWQKLNDEQKQVYNKRAKEKAEEYNKQLNIFKSTNTLPKTNLKK